MYISCSLCALTPPSHKEKVSLHALNLRLAMFKTFYTTLLTKCLDTQVERPSFTAVSEVVCNDLTILLILLGMGPLSWVKVTGYSLLINVHEKILPSFLRAESKHACV